MRATKTIREAQSGGVKCLALNIRLSVTPRPQRAIRRDRHRMVPTRSAEHNFVIVEGFHLNTGNTTHQTSKPDETAAEKRRRAYHLRVDEVGAIAVTRHRSVLIAAAPTEEAVIARDGQ